MSRYRDIQLQVAKNDSHLFNFSTNLQICMFRQISLLHLNTYVMARRPFWMLNSFIARIESRRLKSVPALRALTFHTFHVNELNTVFAHTLSTIGYFFICIQTTYLILHWILYQLSYQLKVSENYSYLLNVRPNICKPWYLNTHFILRNCDVNWWEKY